MISNVDTCNNGSLLVAMVDRGLQRSRCMVEEHVCAAGSMRFRRPRTQAPRVIRSWCAATHGCYCRWRHNVFVHIVCAVPPANSPPPENCHLPAQLGSRGLHQCGMRTVLSQSNSACVAGVHTPASVWEACCDKYNGVIHMS